jgi:hypothetical protein
MSHPVGIDLTPKSAAHFAHPGPYRGALANVTNAGRDAVDAAVSGAHYASDERYCSVRRSRVVLTPRHWCQALEKQASQGDGGKKARSPGRARRKPLKPLRREGRSVSAEPVCSCAFSLLRICTRDRGCSAHPVFSAPSVLKGVNVSGKNSRDMRGENAKLCLQGRSSCPA